MKKVLILGGTSFIGRNLVEALIAQESYDITLFNRQVTQANLFPQLKKLKGDRETQDVMQIENEQWDYVVDLSCYYPAALQRVLQSINKECKYIFISTCSVYDNANNLDVLKEEDAAIVACSTEQAVDRSVASYGNRKAECERLLAEFGLNHVILRPALVYGKYDPTDRFYYWLYQVKTFDQLLLPEKGMQKFSTTYVGDLVESIIQCLEQNTSSSVFNVTTTPETTIKDIVETTFQLLNIKRKLNNANADYLIKNDIAQWTDLPLWINGNHFTYSNKRLKKQLGVKPIELKTSVLETIAYYKAKQWPQPQYGITEAQKNRLLSGLKP